RLAISVGAIAAITLSLAGFFSLLSFVVWWYKIRASENVTPYTDGNVGVSEKDVND
ncbi:13487_t:CDS:1, partial [Acaulospora morrowiae]